MPLPPILKVRSVETYTEVSAKSVTFEWMLESDTTYILSVTPPPQHCSDPCEYTTDHATLTIPLQVGIQYNITGRAERCNGTLSSNETKLTYIPQGHIYNSTLQPTITDKNIV